MLWDDATSETLENSGPTMLKTFLQILDQTHTKKERLLWDDATSERLEHSSPTISQTCFKSSITTHIKEEQCCGMKSPVKHWKIPVPPSIAHPGWLSDPLHTKNIGP